MSSHHDPFDRLKELPSRSPDDLHGERVRRRAQAALTDERKLAARPWLRPAVRVWQRAVVPGFCVGATAMYLFWALNFSARLYGP